MLILIPTFYCRTCIVDATNGRMLTVEAGQPAEDDEDLDHIFDDIDEAEISAPTNNPWRPVHVPLDVQYVCSSCRFDTSWSSLKHILTGCSTVFG